MTTIRRYPSDLTDRQWAIVEPLLPVTEPRGPGGRPPLHSKREIVNAILYIAWAGCAWRMLPRDFPPWRTVYRLFRRLARRRNGGADPQHPARAGTGHQRRRGRRMPRKPDPTAESSIPSRCGAPTRCHGTPAVTTQARRSNGRKRHIVTDTLGLLLVVMVTTASVQDRDGGAEILKLLHRLFPPLRHIFADGGYAGRLVVRPSATGRSPSRSSRNRPTSKASAVLPRRWVVERTFSWLMSWRRLVRDYERHCPRPTRPSLSGR